MNPKQIAATITLSILFITAILGNISACALWSVRSMLPSYSSLFSDSLDSNCSQTYEVNALENSLFILNLNTDPTQARLRTQIEYLQTGTTIEKCYAPEMIDKNIYYIVNRGKLRINLKNIEEHRVEYSLFLDTSVPLKAEQSKSIALVGGLVAFHADLRKDDVLFLDLVQASPESFVMRAYSPHYRVTGSVAGYMLRSYADETNRSLSLTADLVGRYYIIVRSLEGKGVFSIVSKIDSPFWNEWWFWPTVCLLAIAIVTFWFFVRTRKNGEHKLSLEPKKHLLRITGNYCILVTLILWSSSIGAYLYRIPCIENLFYSSIIFFGISLLVRAYRDYLYTNGNSKVSNTWYLTTISSGILSFHIFIWVFGYNFMEWWGGAGSIISSSTAYIVNEEFDRNKARNILISGILFFLLFPFIVYAVKEMVFQPFVIELYEPAFASYIFRVAFPYQTLPTWFILSFALTALSIVYLLIKELK